MESPFAPPAATDCPPGQIPVSEPIAAGADTVSLLPPHLAERIAIGPAASWVVERTWDGRERQDSGSNPLFLLDWQHHAGRNESYQRVVARLDTTRAVHEASQWRHEFDPATQRLTVHSLTVRRGERAVENAQVDRLRVLQREEGLENLVINGRLTVVALLEDVRAGDVLDLSFTIHSQHRIFPTHFYALTFIPTQTLRDFHLSVRFSTAEPMRWKSNDPKLTPAVHEEPAETEWSWHVKEVPATEAEPNVPGWHFVNRWIQVTDFASWAEVAEGMAAAWSEEWQHPELLSLVESIASVADTPASRAERALTFLQDEVRYLSLNTELGGQIPTSPGVVIKRRFGDCKDKAFAAAHLLRLLGIPARAFLVNTVLRQSVRELLPMPAAFDHAVLEYEVDGRRRWVDVTLPFQGGTALSRPAAQFKLGLPIGPGIEDLEEIASDESVDRTELRETFLIDTSGRASSLCVQVTATGREAERWRRSLAHDGVEVFARHRELFYQQLYAGANRVGKLEWQDDRESNELVLVEAFDLKDIVFAAHDAKVFLFRFPAHAIQSALGFSESGQRQHPWELRYPFRIRHIIEIDSSSLPQNLARSAQIDGRSFRFTCHSEQRPGFASLTFVLHMLADHVPAADFETYKAKVRQVWPLTMIMGQLPQGSIVPWKKRTAGNLLPRRSAPLPVPPLKDSSSARLPLGEVAPPLSSKAARGNGAVAPRPERPPRPTESSTARERSPINRPNPQQNAETISNSTKEPMKPVSRRRSRSPRHKRRQRGNFLLWIGTIAGAAVLIAMIHFLMHVK